ncbi:MAG TPA: pilus assembly protein PilM [Verrucomicrobiae bacterium]|nr:pilus assembly protein PilM [Verrucomicrobiae bacterium]
MGWQFLNSVPARRKRNQMLAVDLGSRTTKAVLVERHGEAVVLTRYALLDAPIYEKKFSAELLADHLRSVLAAIGGGPRFVTLAIDTENAVVRTVEMPLMPVGEMRQLLKMNSKNFMQQDMPDCVFDCHIFPPRLPAAGASPAEPVKNGSAVKVKTLAVGAKQQMVADYQAAAKNAGLTTECIVPGLIGLVNAFELAQPQVFANETVALVDLGFKHSTICVLDRGELALSRTVAIGGDRLTAGLAEAMGVNYAAAESAKLGLRPEDRPAVESLVLPLGRELRVSLDFFEHQRDTTVSQIYLSGAAARSELILQILHNELMAECKTWNPTASLQTALPAAQAAELERVGPQLDVAIGAGLAAF